uniref:1 acyl sn glycerol 3 phosphate acyltransferase n=1 Tax=Echinococcus granulosus TaxID=6210 RepID=A0A068WN94_ECHGR|nr:1 acyl sn glycerol 3 phosphate acyltransferase [Echinococcus granulosus]
MILLPLLAIIILVPMTPTVMVLWILLRLIGFFLPLTAYHTFDDKLFSWYQRCVLLFFEAFVTRKIYFYGDHDFTKRKENVLFMCNHQSTVDWIICNMVIARQGGIGRLRYILLNIFKYIPLFGYYVYQHCFIFVNRDNFEAHKAVATMDYVTKNGLSCWIVAFPEVDRFNPKKPKVIEESRAFAKSKNLLPLQYHLTPRVRGMELLLKNMSSHLHAVYDVTVIFADENGSCLDKGKPIPGLFSYLMRPRTLHIHLQRCPIADVPQDHDALRAWLYSRFALKDKLFADLEEIKKNKARQPNVDEVKAAFLRNLSVSKVPNGFDELPRLRRRWLFTAFICLASVTALLLFRDWHHPIRGSLCLANRLARRHLPYEMQLPYMTALIKTFLPGTLLTRLAMVHLSNRMQRTCGFHPFYSDRLNLRVGV